MATGDASPGVVEPDPGLVSVVVLTHDRPRRLARCLASLTAQDADAPLEIVVADDGSGAETTRVVAAAAARDPRVRHVRQAHRGIPATRNLGLRSASGRRVAFVADDYVLDPGYLRAALDYLDAHPEAAVVRFRVVPLDDHFGARVSHCYYDASVLRRLLLEQEGAPRRVADRVRLLRRLPGAAAEAGETTTLEAAGAAVFRREALAAVGGWDERLQRAEDTELTNRLRAAGHRVHFLPDRVVLHDYDRLPFDTVRKCLATGFHRAALARDPAARVVGAKASGLAVVVWRAGAAGSPARALVALPWLALFEAATLAGYVAGVVSQSSKRRRRGTGASRKPDGSVR
jgi:GT2 family glycosyltransferase